MKAKLTQRQIFLRTRAAKLRAALDAWNSAWNNGCGYCEFDEAEGGILDHCPKCRLLLIHAATAMDIAALGAKELKRQLRFI